MTLKESRASHDTSTCQKISWVYARYIHANWTVWLRETKPVRNWWTPASKLSAPRSTAMWFCFNLLHLVCDFPVATGKELCHSVPRCNKRTLLWQIWKNMKNTNPTAHSSTHATPMYQYQRTSVNRVSEKKVDNIDRTCFSEIVLLILVCILVHPIIDHVWCLLAYQHVEAKCGSNWYWLHPKGTTNRDSWQQHWMLKVGSCMWYLHAFPRMSTWDFSRPSMGRHFPITVSKTRAAASQGHLRALGIEIATPAIPNVHTLRKEHEKKQKLGELALEMRSTSTFQIFDISRPMNLRALSIWALVTEDYFWNGFVMTNFIHHGPGS